MKRLGLLLLLASTAVGQGVDRWIANILDPRTSPTERHADLQKVAKTDDGLGKLAAKALDGRRDAEVVHAVVDALLASDKYEPYVESILQLVLVDKHKDKVLTRLKRLAEEPVRGQLLRDTLTSVARGKSAASSGDPKLRSAAIIVLGAVPRRDTLAVVIEVGLAHEGVRTDAEQVVFEIFGMRSLPTAQKYLATHLEQSWNDIVLEQLHDVRTRLEKIRRLLIAELEKANAAKALVSLEGGDEEAKVVASKRLRDLAEQGAFHPLTAEDFAGRIYDAFVAERESETRDATTMERLINTMTILVRGDGKPPLWEARTKAQVVGALQPLADGDSRFADNPLAQRKIGAAAVRLLEAAGAEAKTTLAAFAERFSQPGVRQQGIQSLGVFARRFEGDQDYIGRKLADMLLVENDGTLRAQILSTLALPYVPPVGNAFRAIRAFLEPEDPSTAPRLEDAEIRDAITILGQIGSDEALEMLEKVASQHEQLSVRRFAIEEGLLPWARRNGKAKMILADLVALATADAQPIEARQIVIEALGGKGFRNAHESLEKIANTQGLDPKLKAAVVDAKLVLAERLAVPNGGKVAPEDLQTAIAILEEELAFKDTARLERLARTIVKTGDDAKVPVGATRCNLVKLYKAGRERTETELFRLFEDAAGKAIADGLDPETERWVLEDYKETLKASGKPEQLDRAIGCLRRLAELALAGKKKLDAAKAYLESARLAVKLRDPVQAKDLLSKSMLTEGIVAGSAEDAERKQLQEEAAGLPVPNG